MGGGGRKESIGFVVHCTYKPAPVLTIHDTNHTSPLDVHPAFIGLASSVSRIALLGIWVNLHGFLSFLQRKTSFGTSYRFPGQCTLSEYGSKFFSLRAEP